MQRQCSRNNGESGAYMIVLVLGLVAFIGIVGLAIDAARIYQTKRQLQSVVDSATLSAARLLVRNAGQNYNSFNKIRQATAPVIMEDLRRFGLDSYFNQADLSQPPHGVMCTGTDDCPKARSFGTICFDANGDCSQGDPTLESDPAAYRHIVGVNLMVNRPTLLLGLIPGLSKASIVGASSTSRNLKLQVVLVLDMSDSMNYAMASPPPGCENTPNRLCALKYSAKAFLDSLLPSDEAAIVEFSWRYNDNRRDAQHYDPNNWGWEHWVGDSHGPHNADENDWKIVDRGDWQKVWNNFVDDAHPLSQLMTVQGNLDRLKHQIDSLQVRSSTNIASGIYNGQLVVDRGRATSPENTLRMIVVVTDGAPYWYDPVVQYDSGQDKLMVLKPTGEFEQAYPELTQCPHRGLLDIRNQFRTDPDFPLASVNPYYTTPKDFSPPRNAGIYTTAQWEYYRRLRFMDTIVMADRARAAGDYVFTIGVGDEDSGDGRTLSPFQSWDGRHMEEIKTFFMARLANDQARMRAPNPLPDPPPLNTTYHYDFPCEPGGQKLLPKPQGLSLLANTGAALVDAFDTIASTRTLLTK